MKILLRIIFFLFLIFAVFLESTIFPFPLAFLLLGVYFLISEDLLFFIVAFILGTFLDALTFHTLGATPLFLAGFFIFLYIFEKAFSILDIRVYLAVVWICSIFYGWYAGYPFAPLYVCISLGLLVAVGIFLSRIQKKHV